LPRLPARPLRAPLALLLGWPAASAVGQEAHAHAARSWEASGSLGVIPLLTRATPTAGGRSLTEAYLTQPALWGHASALRGRLVAHGMLNLEGATLARGELNTGTYGEGYVDRRHPHSYLHELLLTVRADVPFGHRGGAVSLTAGRGFAPFGSDDPMSRPFVKYPVNHHLAQVLERAVVVTAARVGGTLPAAVDAVRTVRCTARTAPRL
jgi:hypothetical protein